MNSHPGLDKSLLSLCYILWRNLAKSLNYLLNTDEIVDSMYTTRQKTGFTVGLVGFVLILMTAQFTGQTSPALAVFAVAFLMASWWVSEAIPFAITSLLPIVLFPFLGVMNTSEITLSYGNHYVFLFLGGFMIAVSVERWNLHKRIALYTIQLVGTSAKQIVLGFMLASAFLSMWISNIATTMMMVTIAQAVLRQIEDDEAASETQHSNKLQTTFFATALLLGIAYASSIGGISTLVGTAPNVIFAGVYEEYLERQVSFFQWFQFAFPLAAISLLLAWLYLTHWCFPVHRFTLHQGRASIDKQIQALGPMQYEEKMTLMIFVLVASLWIVRGIVDLPILSMVKDSTIAVLGALLLFMIPAKSIPGEGLLNWQTAVKIPWDILLLFGGGFALAKGFDHSGLTVHIAEQLKMLETAPLLLIIFAITTLVIFLTEITSNTATASLFIPIMLSLGLAMDVPAESLMLAACIAASFAFMLPVATPPNAVVFSTRKIAIEDMMKAGIGLNLMGIVLISLFIYFLKPLLW